MSNNFLLRNNSGPNAGLGRQLSIFESEETRIKFSFSIMAFSGNILITHLAGCYYQNKRKSRKGEDFQGGGIPLVRIFLFWNALTKHEWHVSENVSWVCIHWLPSFEIV